MSTPSKRRLVRDFKRLSTDPPGGISGAPLPDNILIWNAVIFGPADTPFEDGTFKLLLTFDESYPNKPPTVKFLSKMFHPNVYANGELCLDILQNRWSPTYDVAAILTSIQSLLHDPNPNSPANAEAASLYRDNMKEYVRRVKATVEDSWLDDEMSVAELKAEIEAEQDDDDEDGDEEVVDQDEPVHQQSSVSEENQAMQQNGDARTSGDAATEEKVTSVAPAAAAQEHQAGGSASSSTAMMDTA